MAKLSKTLKYNIVEKAIELSGIPAEREQLRIRRAEFAEACRVEAIGGYEALERFNRDFATVETISTLWKEKFGCGSLFSRDSYISLNVAGQRSERAYFSGLTEFRYTDNFERPTPDNLVIEQGTRLAETYFAIVEEAERLDKKEAELTAHVKAILNSVNTDKQLLEVWPEAEKLLPEPAKKQVTALTVPMKTLNEMLGLK